MVQFPKYCMKLMETLPKHNAFIEMMDELSNVPEGLLQKIQKLENVKIKQMEQFLSMSLVSTDLSEAEVQTKKDETEEDLEKEFQKMRKE